tara:strand:+ start:619 stop:900 length:282 start_codon:yes stop_codon:yes gene_type:complete
LLKTEELVVAGGEGVELVGDLMIWGGAGICVLGGAEVCPAATTQTTKPKRTAKNRFCILVLQFLGRIAYCSPARAWELSTPVVAILLTHSRFS